MPPEETQDTPQPPQHQNRDVGLQTEMTPQPEVVLPGYRAAGKLAGKVALITGGDSGIGRSVAELYAKEGADVAIVYYDEHEDARNVKQAVETEGRRFLMMAGDIQEEAFCRRCVQSTVETLGKLDILVNNAAYQQSVPGIEDITEEQLTRTFRTNIFAQFYFVKAALPHLKPGSAIINTSSVTAFKGEPSEIDYSSTKGAITAFTRSLSLSLIEKGIRVNSVAPGPVWTPFIPPAMPEEKVANFGSQVPMKRVGQPSELAPAYVYLASEDSTYVSGQTIHINGGSVVNA